MKRSLFLGIFFCSLCVAFSTAHAAISKTTPASWNRSIAIRVLLDRHGRETRLETQKATLWVRGNRLNKWFRLGKSARITQGTYKKKPVFLINKIKFYSNHLTVQTRPSKPIRLNKKNFAGQFHFHRKGNRFWVINHVPLEDYLKATLGHEMSASWKLEALKAQAVAARSYALFMRKHPKNKLYDLESTIRDQVYGGLSKHKSIQKAVNSTKGLFLTLGKKHPQKAFYHSRCGGHTAAPKQVWPGSKRGKGVPCDYCQKKPYKWSVSYPLRKLSSLLKTPLGAPTLKSAKSLPSGRRLSLKVKAGLSETLVTTDTLRRILGYQQLKSAIFEWKIANGQVHFEGVGSGHGVGMCQWGAGHLAKKGQSYRKILKHYYPNSSLRRLPPV